jgi:dUTP pyrophosphatase
MDTLIDLKILDKRLSSVVDQLKYATSGSAALDLKACIEENIIVHPGQVVLIGTGIAIDIKDPSLAAVILPRSGLGHKNGIILGNTVGLIDSDYQGEIKASIYNRSQEPFIIKPMDRICQMVFLPIKQVTFNVVDDFEIKTSRETGGFGSTGV